MQNRTAVPLTVFILLLVTGLIVLLGLKAKSVWVGVLALFGVLAILYSLGTTGSHQYGGYWIGIILGLVALAAAIWLSHLAGRWWWTPLFAFIGLMFLANGLSLKSEYQQPVGTISILLGVLFFAFAIVGPWFLYGPLSGTSPVAVIPSAAPTTEVLAPTSVPKPTTLPVERGGFFPGIWDFLLGAIKSGWGILYLVLVILLGRIWLGKWGWLIAPIMLLLVAGGLAWNKPGGVEPLIAFFTTRPLEHIISLLGWSELHLGSAAWGSLITGIGLIVLISPAYLVMYSANRVIVRAQRVRQLFGTTFAADFLRGSNLYTPYTSLASFLTVVATVYVFILIWKALAAISATSGAPAFPLLDIVDISLPSWKPVMQWPYFLNAGIYAVISLILTSIQRRMSLTLVSVNWFLTILGAVLLGLFVPAGAITFLTGQSLTLVIVAPLSLLTKTKLVASHPQPKPESDQESLMEEFRRQIAEQERERAEEEARRREAERIAELRVRTPVPLPSPPQEGIPIIVGGEYLDEEEDVEEEEQFEGKLVFQYTEAIIDMIIDNQDRLMFMDLYGDVWWCESNGELTKLMDVNMMDPLGLAAISGGRVAGIDQAGEVFFSSGAPDSIHTSEEIQAFTANSFGSILAYIPLDSTYVRGLILAVGKDQLLIDCGETLTDVHFSLDNRYLGIGAESGKIFVFDMAKREIAHTFTSPDLVGVSHICPVPQGGWVAAYDDSRLAMWDSQGSLLNIFRAAGKVTCLTVDEKSGNIAFGSDLGELTVRGPNDGVLLRARLHESDIVNAVFESDGNSLVTAGSDDAIRRIEF